MKKIFTTSLLLGMSFALFSQKTIIHCGKLIDGNSNTALNEMTIVVEKNRITAIEKGYSNPSGTDKVIDLKAKTVLPGLIDMHVHLESETSRDQFTKRIQYSQADVSFEAMKNGMTTLMAGFTTVRDLGGSGVNISLRNAINRGTTTGPRIFTSGKTIATTGGHGDPSNGLGPNYALSEDKAMNGVINSPEEARQAVRQRYQDGVDCIKITATGGVLSIAKNGKGPQFTDEEVKAVIETAKDYGFHVAAHAHGAEGMKRALRAGVTTIEHGSFMDDEAIELFKKTGAFLVPTITAGRSVADSAKIKGYYHPLITPKAIETGSAIQATFAKAYKAGVKIVFGTDAGVFRHGVNAYEFQFMTESGMPAMDAIKAATSVPASILDQKANIGSIEVGKYADIIATEANPIDDIKTLMNVTFVMKDGVIFKQK